MPLEEDGIDSQEAKHSKYKTLIDEAQVLFANAEEGTLCFEETQNLSNEGLKLLSDVKDVETAMLDMDLMKVLYKTAHLNVNTLTPEIFSFSPVDFAKRIRRFCEDKSCGPNKEPLSVLMCKKLSALPAELLCYSAPGLSTVVGSLEVTKTKNKKPRKKKTKDIAEPVKKPKQVASVEGKTVEKTILAVGKQLVQHYLANGKQPIFYLKFIIDPKSFSRTIENLFYVSFLISNCNATIFFDDLGMPVIMPEASFMEGNCVEKTREDKTALVMSITQDEWKEAIEVLGITESMIKLDRKGEADVDDGASTSGIQQKRKK